jgi:hypothetical protein
MAHTRHLLVVLLPLLVAVGGAVGVAAWMLPGLGTPEVDGAGLPPSTGEGGSLREVGSNLLSEVTQGAQGSDRGKSTDRSVARAVSPERAGDRQGIIKSEEVEWLQVYAGVTAAQLDSEAQSINAHIVKATAEVFERRFSVGDYDVISQEGRYSGSSDTDFLTGLEQVMITSEGEVRRILLSELEYPELHALSRKARWLIDRAFWIRVKDPEQALEVAPVPGTVRLWGPDTDEP